MPADSLILSFSSRGRSKNVRVASLTSFKRESGMLWPFYSAKKEPFSTGTTKLSSILEPINCSSLRGVMVFVTLKIILPSLNITLLISAIKMPTPDAMMFDKKCLFQIHLESTVNQYIVWTGWGFYRRIIHCCNLLK